MAEEKTTITEIEDINTLLDLGTAVMLPEEKKPSVFSRDTKDLSFLDKPIELTPEEKEAKIKTGELNEDGTPKKKDPPVIDQSIDDIIEDKEKGRPKVSKDALLELTSKLIDKKILVPFDDDKPLDKYTVQDFEELLEENFKEKERVLGKEVSNSFFSALPPELQYAAKYVSDGGNDLKGLFRLLAASEEVKSFEVGKDDESIVRTYLQATHFGTDDDIQEEINAWKDREELGAKATKFKPKLDQMQEEVINERLARQENTKKQQQQQAQVYIDSVYKTLEPGELNGIKIDRKTQGMLYTGLTQPSYPSVSGKQTNLLGFLLEKHQFVEPRHDLIAEALWLLADPDGYKAKVRESAKKEITEKTVRTLKTEQANKNTQTTESDDEGTKHGIPRPNANFFKR